MSGFYKPQPQPQPQRRKLNWTLWAAFWVAFTVPPVLEMFWVWSML